MSGKPSKKPPECPSRAFLPCLPSLTLTRRRTRIHQVHDDVKDKDFELELSWCSVSETKGRHELVPKAVADEAERKAKEALAKDEEMED